jgi:predicted  nucleic acid-binding Zn-ribbon protein
MRTTPITWMKEGLLMLACAGLLVACGPQGRADTMSSPRNVPPDEAVDGFQVERAEMESDLTAIRTRIDGRIAEVDNRLARGTVDDEQRRDLLRYREELQDRRSQIERARRDVEGSRTDTWNSVRRATNNTLEDIEDWFERQANRLDAQFRDTDGTVPIED